MTEKQKMSHGKRRADAPKGREGEFVSYTDTKTGGPMGVLDGEDLKKVHGRQKLTSTRFFRFTCRLKRITANEKEL